MVIQSRWSKQWMVKLMTAKNNYSPTTWTAKIQRHNKIKLNDVMNINLEYLPSMSTVIPLLSVISIFAPFSIKNFTVSMFSLWTAIKYKNFNIFQIKDCFIIFLVYTSNNRQLYYILRYNFIKLFDGLTNITLCKSW